MGTDELLDAHTKRMQSDPGYAAIWRKATALPNMQLITAMLAWAEQADGLRALARIAASEPEGSGAVRDQTTILITELLAWCIGQFQGESGAGESYWEQFPEYEAACKIVDMARRAGIITGGKEG